MSRICICANCIQLFYTDEHGNNQRGKRLKPAQWKQHQKQMAAELAPPRLNVPSAALDEQGLQPFDNSEDANECETLEETAAGKFCCDLQKIMN